MKKTIALILVALPLFGLAKTWSPSEVNQIFDLLYSEGAIVASSEVESYGVSSFDFGMDLLAMDKQKALTWFTVQSQVSTDLNYLFGKAWLEMESGNLLLAMQTANDLLNRAEGQLAEARAHYLLGVIHMRGGSQTYALNEIQHAIQLYQSLGKQGGVELCYRLMGNQKNIGNMDPGGDPPRDDEDS